jgi:hypothetical protein
MRLCAHACIWPSVVVPKSATAPIADYILLTLS